MTQKTVLMTSINRGLALVSILTALVNTSCKSDGKFNFLDAATGSGVCEFSDATPTTTTVRAPQSSTGTTTFTVTPAGTDCTISYYLNGTLIPDESSPILNLRSSALAAGDNTLEAKITGAASSDTQTWTIRRNNAPTCSNQTPASTGSTLGVGSNVALTAYGTDTDSDPLTWNWTVNAASPGSGVLAIISNTSQSQGIFAPNSSLVGANTISATMSDGYDSVSCTWTVTVSSTCVISGAVPSAATVRVPSLASATTPFTVSTGGGGCTIAWSLNGVTLGGTTNSQTITSSSLNPSNVLTATATNGGSTTTQSWTIIKNSPPSCVQTPAATGSTLGVGGSLNFTADATDANSDAMTFNWLVDGATVSTGILSPATVGNQSVGTFSPNSSYTGTRNVTAVISDGYDSTNCAWTTTVSPSCAILSSLPSTATVRVANTGSTSTTFGAIANDASCNISWTLNGSTLAGETSSFLNTLSSSLNTGNNTLVATITNGSSTASRTWTVVKNSPPTCGSQVPASAGNTMNHTSNLSLTANGSDANSDPLTFSWKLDNNAQPTLFSVSGVAPQSLATFDPGLAQVGNGRIITAEMNDGYDTGSCQWSVNIEDPNTVTITSCTPASSPVVVTSAGGASSQTLNVAATGTSLTYLWKQDGVTIGGATSPSLTLTAGGLSVGTYTFVSEVTDAYSNMQSCTWTVKRNAPPVLTSPSPSTSSTRRLNYASTLPLSVTGSDGNGDALTYAWKLDGASSGTLPGATSATTFNPASNLTLLGSHTISVTATDGYETATTSWPVEVNLFTTACNDVYNGTSGTAGTTAGKICSLVGSPVVGDAKVPAADQSIIRLQPYEMDFDPQGVGYFSDTLSSVVWVWNRTGSSITRFGMTVGAGEIRGVIGNGAAGSSTDGLTNNEYKLNSPLGVAVDPGPVQGGSDTYSQATLYVADYNNDRVVKLEQNGVANRIFGTGGNGATVNTAGLVGTSHSCDNPSGLKILNINGIRSLVISCYAGNVIKYMGIDAGNAATYNNGYVLVGRLSAGATVAGSVDGTPGPTGDATVNGPWSLSKDSEGNLYWLELGAGRLRTLNLTAGTKTYFNSGNGKTTAAVAVTIGASENGSGWTSSVATTANAPGTTADRFAIWSPTLMRTGVCYPIYVQRKNASNVSAPSASSQTVNVSVLSGTATLYSNPGCTLTTATTTIPANAANGVFYMQTATVGSVTLRSSFGGFTNGDSAAITVAALSGSAANAMNFVAPTEFNYEECIPVRLQFRNGAAIAAVSGATSVRLYTAGTGNFFDGGTCSGAPLNSVTIAGGTTEYTVSYARTNAVAAGNVISLVGVGATDAVAYNGANTTNSIQNAGNLKIRSPRGLAVIEGSSALKGFLIGQFDNQRYIFVNASNATIGMGGATIEPGDANQVLGTGSGGYSSEDIGNLAQINVGYGLYQIDDNTLYFADNANGRLRSLDLAITNGETATLMGQGLLRYGFAGDTSAAATAYLNSPHWLAIDNTNKHLLIADNQNRRVRQVSLLTGIITTVIGKGNGNPTTENEDPTNVFMQGPRALRFYDTGTNQFYIYSDANGGTGTNRSCMLRAWNRFGSTATLFGVSFAANRINTIAGDYNLGCATRGATADGTTGTSTPLYNPDGFAIDTSGNMYISNYDDHCILKMTSAGAISRFMGTCASSAGWPGGSTASTAVLRYPTGITIDTNYSADGNFFFVDGLDQGTGRVRYVNFRTSGITVAGVSIPAGSGANPSVTTVFSLSNAGQGRLYGVAQFGNQFCYSSGDTGNGNNGGHNVTCRDLSSALGAITLRVGPDEITSTVRGGGPLGTEQENVASTSARLYAPNGLAFDADGNLYIADRSNHLVRMVRRWFN